MTDDLVKLVRDNFIDPKRVPWSFKSPNILLYKLADRIEALTAQLEAMKEAHDDVEQYARRHCAEVEALTAERDECKRIADHSEDVVMAAKAEIEHLGCALNVAKYGQPDFAWSVHLDAMAELRAEIERLRALLAEADCRIVWEGHGLGSDFTERVEAAVKGQKP